MRQSVRSIGVLSCGKISGLVYAFIGLILGIFFALASLLGVGAMAASGGDSGGMFGALFGVGAIILMPIFYGVIGFIGGLITAAVYNLAARFVGGLELELG